MRKNFASTVPSENDLDDTLLNTTPGPVLTLRESDTSSPPSAMINEPMVPSSDGRLSELRRSMRSRHPPICTLD